jgi:hypothetical protein
VASAHGLSPKTISDAAAVTEPAQTLHARFVRSFLSGGRTPRVGCRLSGFSRAGSGRGTNPELAASSVPA